MGALARTRSGAARRLAGLALALSLAAHSAALGVAALLVAGPGDPPERAPDAPLRLDLRRAPDRAAAPAPLREPRTERSGIPGAVELALERSDPIDHEAWAEPAPPAAWLPPAAEARHASDLGAFPDLDAVRGGRRVTRRARGAAVAGGPVGAGAQATGGGPGAGDGSGAERGGTNVPAGAERTPPSPETAPRALVSPRPEYPATARLRGEQGTVRCRVHVRLDGVVERVEVLVSSGSDRLDQAAVEALRRWRYEPALRDGEPVAAAVEQAVRFALVASPR